MITIALPFLPMRHKFAQITFVFVIILKFKTHKQSFTNYNYILVKERAFSKAKLLEGFTSIYVTSLKTSVTRNRSTYGRPLLSLTKVVQVCDINEIDKLTSNLLFKLSYYNKYKSYLRFYVDNDPRYG